MMIYFTRFSVVGKGGFFDRAMKAEERGEGSRSGLFRRAVAKIWRTGRPTVRKPEARIFEQMA